MAQLNKQHKLMDLLDKTAQMKRIQPQPTKLPGKDAEVQTMED